MSKKRTLLCSSPRRTSGASLSLNLPPQVCGTDHLEASAAHVPTKPRFPSFRASLQGEFGGNPPRPRPTLFWTRTHPIEYWLVVCGKWRSLTDPPQPQVSLCKHGPHVYHVSLSLCNGVQRLKSGRNMADTLLPESTQTQEVVPSFVRDHTT